MIHIPSNPYKETPKEDRTQSQRRKPKELPPENGQEEDKKLGSRKWIGKRSRTRRNPREKE